MSAGASAEVLQEYLIRIGYKIDALSEKKFSSSVSGTTKNVLKLGTTVAGAAIAATKAVNKFAHEMRQMYFASDLANTSVKNLKAMDFAAKQVGISTGSMTDILANFGAMRRTWAGSGATSYLKMMGIDASSMRDSSAILDELLFKLPELFPVYQDQALIAEQIFGINEKDYFLLSQKKEVLSASKKLHEEIYAQQGLNYNNSRKDLESLATEWDIVGVHAEAAKDRIMLNMVEPAHLFAIYMNDLFDKLPARLNAIGAILDHFNGFEMFRQSGKDLEKLKEGYEGKGFARKFLHGKLTADDFTPAMDLLGSIFGRYFEAVSSDVGAVVNPSISMGSGFSAYSGSVNPNDVISFFVNRGYTPAQAAGIAANIEAESGFDPNAKEKKIGGQGYGLAQWGLKRQKDFKDLFKHSMQESTGLEQLQFMDWEFNNTEKSAGDILKQQISPASSGYAMSKYYERSEALESDAAYRATLANKYMPTGNTTFSQNVTYNLHGNNNELMQSVGTKNDRLYGDITKYLDGAVK